MGRLFGTALPRSCRDLMALLGHLNFAAQFIPNYKRQVKPLTQLLKGSGGGQWREEPTHILNELAQLVS